MPRHLAVSALVLAALLGGVAAPGLRACGRHPAARGAGPTVRPPGGGAGRDRAVTALYLALETRDPMTGAHCFRVGRLSRFLAPSLGIDPDRAELAGRLHDLGKLGLPDSILSGRSRLSDIEFARIRLHPVHGRVLARKLDLAPDLVASIGGHHERWDGSGYPQGLAGETIPPMARLVAVADTLDAITSRRTYKAARPFSLAWEVLREARDRLFDPQVVDWAAEHLEELEDMVLGFQALDRGRASPP